MPGTFFGFDVSVLTATDATPTTWDLAAIYADCTLSLDIETDKARAVRDVQLADAGFDFEVQKARSWGLRLGNVLTTDGTVANRKFGWDLTGLTVGGVNILSVFTRAAVTIRNEVADARATHDTADNTVKGWRTYRIHHSTSEVEADAVIASTAALLEAGITNWGTGLSWSLAGGGLTLSGTGVPSGGQLDFPTEAATQNLRLAGQGLPTLTGGSASAPSVLTMALNTGSFAFVISRPGGTSYTGNAFLTEARLETPDAACLQNATFQGSGALAFT